MDGVLDTQMSEMIVALKHRVIKFNICLSGHFFSLCGLCRSCPRHVMPGAGSVDCFAGNSAKG